MEAGAVSPPDVPILRPFAELIVSVGDPIEVGPVGGGVRRLIPITGGHCRARDWQARILSAGADFQMIANDRVAFLEARYVMETDGGDRIYVENRAIRCGPVELVARLARGEPVDPQQIYFRCTPRFEAASPALSWLMERIFVGTGIRRPTDVELAVFEVC